MLENISDQCSKSNRIKQRCKSKIGESENLKLNKMWVSLII